MSKPGENGYINANVNNKAMDVNAGKFSKSGSGVSGNLNQQFGLGGSAAVKGQVGLIKDPNQQATVWAQHQRNLDKNMRSVGPATNSAGINYQHNNGAEAFLAGSKTGGSPAVGAVGAHVPVISGNNGNTNFGFTGQSSFGKGRKPNHDISMGFNHKF